MRLLKFYEFIKESSESKLFLPDYDYCVKLCQYPDSPFYETKTIVDGYSISIFNYRLAQNKDFQLPGAKEMRGITFVFNEDSTVFKRFLLLEKFFNLNQVPDTMYSVVKNYKIKFVNEKEDGSIASFVKLPNGTVLGKSKMSFESEQAIRITQIYKSNQFINKFVNWCLNNDIIPIFEYVAPSNRIVLRYSQEELILLRLRDNKTGKHIDLKKYLDNLEGIKIAPFKDDLNSLEELIELTGKLEDKEGFVIQAEDESGNDFFFKLKSPWYVERHGLLTEDIHKENKIIEYILADKIDDVLGQIPEDEIEARNRINKISDIVTKALREKTDEILELYKKFIEMNHNKKDFALKYRKHRDFPFVMSLSNGQDLEEITKKWLSDNTKRLNMARLWLSKEDPDMDFNNKIDITE